jgi:hypothetical protein
MADVFEFNDIFGVLNVLVVMPLMIWTQQCSDWTIGNAALFGYTVGISIYGTAYIVV